MIFSKNSLPIVLLLSMNIAFASDEVSNDGKISGLIRTFYINKKYTNPVSDSSALSASGQLKYESSEWKNLKVGVAGYASDVFVYKNNGEANSVFEEVEGNSFAYLAEGYIDYRFYNAAVRIGRQLIYTPLIVSSDIRRVSDTFEAVTATYSGIEDTSLFSGYVKRWAGYDSGPSISRFKRPAEESSGAAVLGITHVGFDDLEIQGWFYSIDKMADIMYAQSDYTIHLSDMMKWDISAQIARFSEDIDKDGIPTGIDGTLYGVQTSLNTGPFTLNAAYNHVFNKEGKFVINGLGNGPYYTSREEWSLEGMEDGRAYCGSIDVNMAPVGMEELTISTVYEVFKSAPRNIEIEERELILTYKPDDTWNGVISYVRINDIHNNAGNEGFDADYNRFMIRLGYHF